MEWWRRGGVLALAVGLAACGGVTGRSEVQGEEPVVVATPTPDAAPVRSRVRTVVHRSPAEAARAAQRTHEVVKTLMAETTLDSSGVQVETDEAAQAVILRGTVPSTRQRELAGRLARDSAPGYTVRNELGIVG